MSQYKNILVAVDLSEDTTSILQTGLPLLIPTALNCICIHVIEPLSFAYGGDIPMDFSGIQEEIHQQASQQMLRLSEIHTISMRNINISSSANRRWRYTPRRRTWRGLDRRGQPRTSWTWPC